MPEETPNDSSINWTIKIRKQNVEPTVLYLRRLVFVYKVVLLILAKRSRYRNHRATSQTHFATESILSKSIRTAAVKLGKKVIAIGGGFASQHPSGGEKN